MAQKPENDETPEKDGVDPGLRESDGIRINGDMKNEGSDLALTELVCVKENGEAPEKDYVDSGLIKGDEIISKGENKVKGLDLASTELKCIKENGEVPEKDNVNLGLSKGDGIRSDGDDIVHKGLDLASTEPDCNKDLLADRNNEADPERMDCGEDVYACADANADTARPKIGRGRRGRKRKRARKRAESTEKEKGKVKSGLEKSEETNSTSDEKQSQVPSLTDTGCVEDSLATFERKTDTKRNGSDDSEHMECNGEADDNAHGNNLQDMPKIGRGKRGRKRKMVESAVCNRNDGTHKKKKFNKAFLHGKSEVVARILRSRTPVTSGVEKMADGGLIGGVVDGKGKKEVSHPKIIEMEKSRSAQSVGRRKKKLKGRRGRPPKVQGISGPLKATDREKQNEMGSRKNGDQLDSKKVTRGSEFVDEGKNSELVSVSHSNHEGEKISVKQSKRIKHEEGGESGMSRSREKQLLTERIKAMLKSAGWTIEYRRRLSKENYFDAVYVTPQGSGHWSVTLAYNVLKKQVEDGKADSRAISAFIPIPEEEFSILLRKTDQKPRSDKGIPRKKWVEKKHAMEKMNGSRHKHKEKQGSVIIRGDKFSNRRTKMKSSDREQEKSANKLQKGMQISNRKRYALLVRDSKKELDPDSEGFVIYNGKRSLLSWMIDLGTVSLNEKVQYMDDTSGALLEGRITRDGIQCDCCNETFAVLDFESHAGRKLSQPFQNIYVESGSSLLQCLQDSWNKHEGSECTGFRSVDIDGDDPNDDTCNKCGDGGDLICCDGCPSTFHQKCLNIQNFPSGDWHCVYCSCKFCGMVDGNMYERDQSCDTSGSSLLTCCLCEEKYHQVCIHGKDSVHFDPNCPSFCGKKCQEVFERLQELLWVKHQLEEGFSWTLVQHSDVDQDISLSGVAQKVESNSKLAVAFSIMDECFLPIIDQRSGTNMIRNVVYSCGSNFNRLNYSGFFTAILERGDEIISVASIRIHGNHLAEMPFIGTRHIYRRQGMCRRLLNGIEAALCSLNVEKLVIPAISELLQTWTSVFGFMPLEESNRKEMKHMNMIVFPGIDMLQKPLSKQQFSAENLISTAAARSIKSRTEHETVHEGTIKSECATSETMKFQESVTIQNFSHSGVSHVTDDNEEFERKDTKDSEVSLGNDLEFDGMHTSEKIHKHENVHSGYTNFPSYENTNGKGNEGADGELIGGVKSVNHICSTLDEDSVQLSAEIKTQPQDLDLIPGCNVLGKNFINHDSIATNLMPSNVKCEPELGNPAPLSPRALDVVSECEAYDGNCSSHLRDFPGSQELKDDASVHNSCFPLGGVFNDVAKPNFETSYVSNGLYKSSECQLRVDQNDTSAVNTSALDCSFGVSQISCVVTGNIHDLKVEFTVAHSDSHSLDVDSLPKRPQMSTNCAKESKSPSHVDHTSVTECDSEPPCNSSSSPALTHLCNASGIPEVGSCRMLRSGKLC